MTEERTPLLEVTDLKVNYGAIAALRGVSLKVCEGEIVCVIGSNGAGKSTLMNAIIGQVARESGDIAIQGCPLAKRNYQVVRQGISLVPEGRRIFAPLTVVENLTMGAFPRTDRSKIGEDLDWVYTLFPRLKERQGQYAGTLSGGEQQMLAIGRALMGRPKLLLLDEPSMGLAPLLVEEVFNVIKALKAQGMTILLVEQNASAALAIADRGYVLETGSVTLTGPGQELLQNEDVRAAYLGM